MQQIAKSTTLALANKYFPSKLTLAQPQPPTFFKQPCLGQGSKGMKPYKEILQQPNSRRYHEDIS